MQMSSQLRNGIGEWNRKQRAPDVFQAQVMFEFSVAAQRHKVGLTAAGNARSRRDCPESLTGGKILCGTKGAVNHDKSKTVKATTYDCFHTTLS